MVKGTPGSLGGAWSPLQPLCILGLEPSARSLGTGDAQSSWTAWSEDPCTLLVPTLQSPSMCSDPLFLASLPFSTNSSLGSGLGDGALSELRWDPQPEPQLPPDEQQAQKSVERTD